MTRIKCRNSLAEEHQCWKWHHLAGVPSESAFQGALKAVYLHLWVPETSGVSHLLNPSSSAPASHLLSILATTISDNCCYSFFLFLYLITMITAFSQQTKISATLLFCSFKITVTRQRRISVDIIFFLIECTGACLDSILQGQFVIFGSLSSLAFSVDLRFQNSFSHCSIHPTPSGSIFNAR